MTMLQLSGLNYLTLVCHWISFKINMEGNNFNKIEYLYGINGIKLLNINFDVQSFDCPLNKRSDALHTTEKLSNMTKLNLHLSTLHQHYEPHLVLL